MFGYAALQTPKAVLLPKYRGRGRKKEGKATLGSGSIPDVCVQFVRMGVVGGLMMTSVWGTRREHNSEELLLLIKGTGDQSVC
jgi:hypothetical protein